MLVQSHTGTIELLPALPRTWPTGRISGLRARGGFEVSLSWLDGRLQTVEILSHQGGECRLESRLSDIFHLDSESNLDLLEASHAGSKRIPNISYFENFNYM